MPHTKKQRCANGARRAEQVSERRHSEYARATSAALINYMHVHYNLISGSEREEPTCKYLSMSTQIILFQCLLIPIHTIAVCNTVARIGLDVKPPIEPEFATFRLVVP